jgi:peptidoglycan-associated lipoprotein
MITVRGRTYMTTLRRHIAPALAVALVLTAACAKRPDIPVAAAPAPEGRVAERPAPAPPAPAQTPPPPAPAPAPTAAPAPRAEKPKDFMPNDNVKTIHFDFDKSDIRPGDLGILETNAAWLKANPGNLLLIEGHCDERGTNEYNLALGDRRAKAIMNVLVAQGVRADRISMISYGEERPVCAEHGEGCWTQNRRGQFLLKAQ